MILRRIVAATALVGDKTLDGAADPLFNVGDDAFEPVPVVRVAVGANAACFSASPWVRLTMSRNTRPK